MLVSAREITSQVASLLPARGTASTQNWLGERRREGACGCPNGQSRDPGRRHMHNGCPRPRPDPNVKQGEQPEKIVFPIPSRGETKTRHGLSQ